MSVKKSIRVPEDLYEFIESLPKSAGKDFSAKVVHVLYEMMEERDKGPDDRKRQPKEPKNAAL